ncbi:MAG: VOC family protein [Chitinophagaceae bacterium]
MNAIVPYLSFNGNAAEALSFYSKAFDGKILFQQTFGQSPVEVKPDYKDKIMHASFQAGDLLFMVSDGMPGHLSTNGTNVNLSLSFDILEEIEKKFAALSDGATITMPLQDTFWGAKFGMLTDKYGVNWMFNYDYPKDAK